MNTPAGRGHHLYTNVNEPPYNPGYYGGAPAARQPASSSYHHHQYQASYPVENSTYGAGSSSMPSPPSSSRSRNSSISSCTSHASNRTLNHHIIGVGIDLPCDFRFAGCRVQPFRAVDLRDWISHSFSHFDGVPLPSRVLCTFCDAVFEAQGGDNQALEQNWSERMHHIAIHFGMLESEDQLRPDFGVIHHMWKHGLLSREDWKAATAYSERPHGFPGVFCRRQPDVRGDEEGEDRPSGVNHISREELREMKKRDKKYRRKN